MSVPAGARDGFFQWLKRETGKDSPAGWRRPSDGNKVKSMLDNLRNNVCSFQVLNGADIRREVLLDWKEKMGMNLRLPDFRR